MCTGFCIETDQATATRLRRQSLISNSIKVHTQPVL